MGKNTEDPNNDNTIHPLKADEHGPVDAPKTDEHGPVDAPKKKGKEESMIVHRVNGTDEKGLPKVYEHGPMPVSEWADYEKENGL